MDWIEVAQDTDMMDVWLWIGSKWLSLRTGGMCGYGLYRAGRVNGQVGCMVRDWIELAQYTDRWDVQLWTGSSCLSIRTGWMCGYGLNRAG